jgi:cytoskeletal protein CcmA (bactofilin family)
MINFNRGSGDRPPESQDGRSAGAPVKPALRPAVYEPPSHARSAARAAARSSGAEGLRRRDLAPWCERARRRPPARRAASALPSTAAPAPAAQPPASRLFVGVNIKLKGVEISDCDLLVIEGHVEATVHSKEMEISPPGTLHGTAQIDVAEVHGEFTGELTARTRLVVHGTGKVSGTIRYGKLIVAEGGTISGDMKQIDAVETPSRPASSRGATHDARHPNGVVARRRGPSVRLERDAPAPSCRIRLRSPS